MPACKHIAEQIGDAHDGQLSMFRRAWLKLHLWICSPCRSVDCSMKNTFDALRGLRDVDPLKKSGK